MTTHWTTIKTSGRGRKHKHIGKSDVLKLGDKLTFHEDVQTAPLSILILQKFLENKTYRIVHTKLKLQPIGFWLASDSKIGVNETMQDQCIPTIANLILGVNEP